MSPVPWHALSLPVEWDRSLSLFFFGGGGGGGKCWQCVLGVHECVFKTYHIVQVTLVHTCALCVCV